MSNRREPVDLIMAKGKKHLTKQEIVERKNKEIKVDSKPISRPEFLPAKYNSQFDNLAQRLIDLKIFTDLDTELLARYFLSKENYVKFTARLRTELNRKAIDFDLVKDIQTMQDKAFKQMRDCANDLGLSITSRAKLVIPPSESDDYEL